jgi:hypothetical protein
MNVLFLAVGAFSSSVDQALALAPAIMVIFIVFGGLYVVNTPPWLSIMPKGEAVLGFFDNQIVDGSVSNQACLRGAVLE